MPRGARYILLFVFAVSALWSAKVQAQHFDITDGKKRVYVPFKMVRSMVVIQLKINNSGPYNFVLDTGVGIMLITDHTLIDSMHIANKRTIKINGLGEREQYEAVVAPLIKVNIAGSLVSQNLSAAILQDDFFGLSDYAGIPIHGLIGHDFFNRLAVKVSFTDSTLVVTPPGKMRIFRKAEILPLTVEENKPYIHTEVNVADGKLNEKKLLIDLGAGHALSLEGAGQIPENCIPGNLGVGLNGLINGYLGRVGYINIGKFQICNLITSFPSDDPAFKTTVQRDGSIGMGILKRFDIIFDYQNGMMCLKPNLNFKEVSEHDMSGMSYHAAGKNFNRLIVEKVDPGSAAADVGILPNDEILSINFKPVNRMSLQQVDDLFKSKDGRNVLVEISRGKLTDRVVITLKRRI
ncbi:PDZ domain-containing protein [Mucilaginibacter auburnensis]|uniref:Aspartyl protease n=1 Tax=Mucilaginibacter auburnensis TaxID=1457233 RepID=A0A2H9VSA4_9SPHI|nr:PDZ domain-containing protein [Mucilaginibacter auburnensis]PJJ83695.1 aspartyl protease [Mucilaginibacter auburnensis]